MIRSHIHRTRTLAALAALWIAAAPATAAAGVLASGYLFSASGTRLACQVLNVGSSPVKITSAKVVLDTGTPFTDFNECAGATLAPGANCTVSGPGDHMAGIVAVEGPTKGLRGTCMLLTAGQTLIGVAEMR
jgi:hypothetical protein